MLVFSEYFQLLDLNLKLTYIIFCFIAILFLAIILYLLAIYKQFRENKKEKLSTSFEKGQFLELRKDYELEIGKIKKIYKLNK